MEQGLLINCTHDKVLRFLPPYILTEQDVDRAVTVLKRVFKKAKRRAVRVDDGGRLFPGA